MFTKILLSTIILVFSLASASSPSKGLIATLIPPTSPQSPFYAEILKASNISITTENVTLNRSQYMEWLIAKYTQNMQGEVSFEKEIGHHVVDMHLGSPKQRVYGIFDTSNDIVWIQCVKKAQQMEFTYYNYSESSTFKHVPCDDMKCNTSYINIIGCKRKPSCAFMATYGNATVAYGPLATDAVTFKPESEIVQNFTFGCSVKNSPRMMGVIGASNSGLSLPRQLYPDDPKFSYCISSDMSKTNLIKFGPAAELRGDTLDMLKNLHTSFYYLDVVSVQVNGQDINVRPVVFEMNNDGSRGFIADSTTALTILTSEAFDALKKKIEEILGHPATKHAIFEICYPSSMFGKGEEEQRPSIGLEVTDFTLEFEEFRVWQKIPKSEIKCLQIIRTMSTLSVLGFEQLVDINIGHDPNNNLMYMDQSGYQTVT